MYPKGIHHPKSFIVSNYSSFVDLKEAVKFLPAESGCGLFGFRATAADSDHDEF